MQKHRQDKLRILKSEPEPTRLLSTKFWRPESNFVRQLNFLLEEQKCCLQRLVEAVYNISIYRCNIYGGCKCVCVCKTSGDYEDFNAIIL